MGSAEDAVVRVKRAKAEEFQFLASLAVGQYHDAAASLAASAAINASDALIVHKGGAIPNRQDHQAAVKILRRLVDGRAAGHLAGALRMKSKSQYSATHCTDKEAHDAVLHSGRLLDCMREEVSDSGSD
ncbi:hypothetical protein [Curtobacterium sp. MCLR17_034]|uniref:hypothetical protein n=1 Tax=Curtobacterium sp. MCLR17_034 TaxID=2175623 RepID=UPI0011B697FE|nr:hypothetical protein [Curtobacterium sp. MCLR17_034]